jgi:hypothetical protein
LIPVSARTPSLSVDSELKSPDSRRENRALWTFPSLGTRGRQLVLRPDSYFDPLKAGGTDRTKVGAGIARHVAHVGGLDFPVPPARACAFPCVMRACTRVCACAWAYVCVRGGAACLRQWTNGRSKTPSSIRDSLTRDSQPRHGPQSPPKGKPRSLPLMVPQFTAPLKGHQKYVRLLRVGNEPTSCHSFNVAADRYLPTTARCGRQKPTRSGPLAPSRRCPLVCPQRSLAFGTVERLL